MTLREAIASANANASVNADIVASGAYGDDVITFRAGLTGAIILGGAQLVITDAVSIAGPGAPSLAISGNHASRVFQTEGTRVGISGVTISAGKADIGGGIYNRLGTLTLTDTVLSDNMADNGGAIANLSRGTVTITDSTIERNRGSAGAGLDNRGGTVTISRTTFADNAAASRAGAMSNRGSLSISHSTISGNAAEFAGGIENTNTVRLTNTTISGNTAGVGGGILNSGSFTLWNSTVVANIASSHGGGISNAVSPLTMRNTIVVNNLALGAASDVSGVAAGTHNLIGVGGSGGLVDGVDGNLVGVVDAELGPLRDNGGNTRTHALLLGSPAIDAGDHSSIPAGVTTDQRGAGFARVVGPRPDIGAFESDPQPTLVRGTAGDDHFYARRSEATLLVFATADGSGVPILILPQPLSGTLHFDGLDGDDVLTVDLSGGDLYVAGLVVASPGRDALRLINGDGRTVTLDAPPTLNQHTWDLGTAGLRISSGSILTVEALVGTAFASSPAWTGPGLTSAGAAAHALTTLAVGALGDGIVVKHTYDGDANLDGRINADDYFRIDQGFLAQPQDPLYAQGDFNYDGRINADDYFLIDQAFLGQGAPLVGEVPVASTITTSNVAASVPAESPEKLARKRAVRPIFSDEPVTATRATRRTSAARMR